MRELNFNHLYNFHVVAAAGSLSEGARQLGLAPSTVSEQLSLLESTVGHRLFDRTSNGLRLTAEGRAAIEHTSVMFAAAERLAAVLRSPLAPDRTRLDVGVSSNICQTLAARIVLPLFESANVLVRLRQGELSDLLKRLHSREVDVILTALRPDDAQLAGVTIEFLRRARLAVLVSSKVRGQIEDFSRDVGKIPLVQYGPTSSLRPPVDRYLRERGLTPPVLAEVDDVEIARRLAAQAGAWCIIPKDTADESRQDLELMEVLDERFTNDVHAIFPQKDPSELVVGAVRLLKRGQSS